MPTIWKGSIAFGLVNVPVELRPAVRNNRVSFRMLHESSNAPIRYKRIREDTGKEVPWKEIVKGYEHAKGEFVILDDADFKKAAVEKSDTIDVQDFIEVHDVDPRFYESAYFLVPGKGGARAYALLRDAMAETSMAGLGKIIVHKRQHIAEIRAQDKALVLLMLRFADEVIDASEYEFPAATGANARELKMATELVRSLKTEFAPEKYVDEYDANLRRIIQAKSKGKRITLTGPSRETPEPKVLDLMERLQQSLKETKETKRKTRAPSKTASRARTRRQKTA